MSWAEENHDRLSQAHELSRLADLGVTRIDLAAWRAPRCDGRGNCEIERSAFRCCSAAGDVREGAVVDVYLRAW